jgi:hypothetical protein
MTNKQRLALTWIGKENRPRREPRICIEVADDPQREDSPVHCHEATLAICHEPRCECSNIRFQWLPVPATALAAAASPAREFWFNLNEKSILLTPELEKEPESLRLAEIIRAELTEADQRQLREWFLAAKLAIIQTTPVSEIDITNMPDADDGAMIGFVDVFPCGLALNFTWNNEAWAVDEQYCVQPGCKCKETVLSFLKLMYATGQKTTVIQDTPSLRYNYYTQASKPVARGSAGSPSLEGLLAALKREQASLNTQLELRHLIMQSLYARHYLGRAGSHLQSQSTNPLSAVPHKIGRNEPCPCGSGRKYKQCCLKKPRA